jgi:hypothetical protein
MGKTAQNYRLERTVIPAAFNSEAGQAATHVDLVQYVTVDPGFRRDDGSWGRPRKITV